VGVRVLETAGSQRAAMRAGTRRLLRLTVPSPLKWVQGRLGNAEQLALAGAPHGDPRAVLEDAALAALDHLTDQAGGPAWDEAGFRRLRDHVAGGLAEATLAAVRRVVAILDAVRGVESGLDRVRGDAHAEARRDVQAQLGRLVFPGFVAATGVDRLADVERYLRAAARRLERLPDAVAVDRDRMRGVRELEAAYRERIDALPPGTPLPPALREVKWMLEELRVSHFAQAVGTRGPVSAKRVRRALQEAA